jgi:hypothetical protein
MLLKVYVINYNLVNNYDLGVYFMVSPFRRNRNYLNKEIKEQRSFVFINYKKRLFNSEIPSQI